MGLDMSLSVKRTIRCKNDNRVINLDKIEKYTVNDYKIDEFGVSNRVEVTEEFAYWRKANQIHRWFIDNFADGEDDCKPVYVDEDKLHILYDICNNIVDMMDGEVCTISKELKEEYEKKGIEYVESFKFDKNDLSGMMKKGLYEYTFSNDKVIEYCKEKLPTTSGFFFGSTDYDCGYLYDLIKTILMFDRMFLKLKEFSDNNVWYDIEYSASW